MVTVPVRKSPVYKEMLPMFQRPLRALSVSAPVAALALIGLLLPSVSAAQDRTAQQIKLRQSVYTVLGAQVTMMGAMASGRAPFDAASFKTAAQRAAFMASIAPDVFPAGSTAPNSKAKAELWQNSADFTALMADFGDKTAALAKAAEGGTLESVRPAFVAATRTCKACHDKYKLD
jgi:cytochrome c556